MVRKYWFHICYNCSNVFSFDLILINPFKVNRYISGAPIIYIGDAFYVFGGETDINWNDTTIGKLDVNLVWSRVGDLNRGRRGHNVIFEGNYALVIGGYSGTLPTEKCILSSNGVNCTEQSPSLYNYAFYPELFMVAPDFCKN